MGAVERLVLEYWPDSVVQEFEVPSGVADQPRTDHETKLGAQNRAQEALIQGKMWLESENTSFRVPDIVGVGMEGGVFSEGDELWSTVWAAVTDSSGGFWVSNGARIKLPPEIAGPIKAGGEMGPVVSELMNIPGLRQKEGMIGAVTKGFVERTEEYQNIVKLALGLWYGQDWYQSRKKDHD